MTLCLFVYGCANIAGGAVELSWKLRPHTGTNPPGFLACSNDSPISRVRLDWEVNGVNDFKTWPCPDGHGVTAFEIPPGDALFVASPVCIGQPAAPQTYTAPAPERRRVNVGETISLGAVELILEVSSCDLQPCVCQ